jgi:hypothetical protein
MERFNRVSVSELDNLDTSEFIEAKATGWNKFPTVFIVDRVSRNNIFIRAKFGSTKLETVKHADFEARFRQI